MGPRECSGLILEGLRRLEYRGYDSAGIAVVSGADFAIRRAAGKLNRLAEVLRESPLEGTTGLGHTRWATHGAPTEHNAHPHRAGSVVLVHNGIIENHLDLRHELEAEGHEFASETDTEIVAHLVSRERKRGLALPEAVRMALGHVRGAYAIAVVDWEQPDTIVAAKNASPLVIGLGEGETFLASDIPAILSHTREMVFLGEGEMAVLRPDGITLRRIADGASLEPRVEHIAWTAMTAEKDGYKHFMLKEIHEQPRAIADTLRGRVSLERGLVELAGLELDDAQLRALQRITIVACGTSWHAGLVGEYLIERFAGIPVEVELASEYRYRLPVVDARCLVVAISQSGETADTLAALDEASRGEAPLLGICNVVGSSITRKCGSTLMTLAGPEISVASTKAFTTQIVALYLLAVRLGRARGRLDETAARAQLQPLLELPSRMEELLSRPSEQYVELAQRFNHATNMLYLGRGLGFPIALEGALKLKELSYIHAEGYAAGEMKHGPIALIDRDVPTVVVAPDGPHFEKTLANVAEIRARGGPVIAVTTDGIAAERLARDATMVITVPAAVETVQPLLCSIPMQLIAYHMADFKGTDVDQPRNLAKSVTVE